MEELFIRPKPCKILVLLKDNLDFHLSKIAKESGTTFVYVSKLTGKLEKLGVVTLEIKGKRRMVRLSEKGKEIAGAIYELEQKLKQL